MVDRKIRILLCLLSSMIVTIISYGNRVSSRDTAIVYPLLIFGEGVVNKDIFNLLSVIIKNAV